MLLSIHIWWKSKRTMENDTCFHISKIQSTSTKQLETFDQQVMPSNKQIIGAIHYCSKGNHNTMKPKTQENIKGATNKLPFLVAKFLQIIDRIELRNSPLECKEREEVMVHNRGDEMQKGKKCGQGEMAMDSLIHSKP